MSSTETKTSEITGLESNSAAPATTIEDDPSEEIDTGDKRTNGDNKEIVNKHEDNTGNDDVGTPRKEDMAAMSLEDQLRKLTLKLHEIEKQTELDRLKQDKLERQVRDPQDDDIRMPLPFPVDSDDYRRHRQVFYRRPEVVVTLDRSPDEDQAFDVGENSRLGAHRRQMISMYQRELSFLEKEERMVNSLMEERERFMNANMRSSERHRREGEIIGAADPSVPPPPFAISELNYVEWATFRGSRILGREEKDCFAIDILRGEPVLVWESRTNYSYSRRNFRHGEPVFSNPIENVAERKTPAISNSKKQQQLLPGQAALPERIRINSRHILKVLAKILGSNPSNDDWDPVVMIRPFKTLVFYHDQIRQRIQELENKFGVPDHSNESLKDEDDNTPITGSEDTAVVNYEHKTIITEGNQGPESQQPEAQSEAEKKDGDDKKQIKEEEEAENEDTSIIALHHLRLLDDFMFKEVQVKMDYLAGDLCKMVSFNDLWYFFSPGDEVIDKHCRQAYRVMSVTSTGHKVIPPYKTSWDRESAKAEETPVILKCVYIDFDGKQLGPISKTIEIPRYDGEKAVTTLEVYPIRFAKHPKSEDKDALRNSLIARGKKFLDVAGVKHMHYNGYTLETKEEVDSQVVIDFEEAFSWDIEGEEDWTPQLEVLIEPEDEERETESCEYDCCKGERTHEDADSEKKRNEEYIGSLVPEDRNKDPSVAIYPRTLDPKSPAAGITEDELVIMSYRVFGFVLRSRKWAKLDLTFLHPFGYHRKEMSKHSEGDIDGKIEKLEQNVEGTTVKEQKQKTAFEELVLPSGHKDMLLSLISQHFRDKESTTADEDQNDIVRGKGKGLIILLHGLPGVGKTTTAEGVAELFRKPLFQITCGDLGTTAADVETALEKHFALASRWGCILLLDEADVFLAARTPQDFIRNGLVAVFLRVLEYYTGILFLTTNRVGDFDEAFASRIHISLHYPELELDSTLEIFKLNLRLIRERRKVSINESEILLFAENYWTNNKEMRWNGRQIRNACQTALALAEFEAQGKSHETVRYANAEVKFTVEHLKIVSKAYLDFIIYLRRIFGQNAERRAKAMGIRAREGAIKNHQDDNKEEDNFKERGYPKAATTTIHPTAPVKAMPHAEQAAPPQPGYPFGGPPPPWQGSYIPVPPGFIYPPHAHGAPTTGWLPQQAAGQHGYPPSDAAGGHQ